MSNPQAAAGHHHITRERLSSYHFRKAMLLKLRTAIEKYEPAITRALEIDLGKKPFETYATETGLIYSEINYALRHLRRWMRPRRVASPLVLWPSVSRIYPVSLGRVLIIAPWNYPFQLQLVPLVAAIAAGNTAVLKPSELTPNTAKIIEALTDEYFPREYISVVSGDGAAVVPPLIRKGNFQHIFFTGGTETGRRISMLAAEHSIPVTLELGGKSPAIVDRSADATTAAKNIMYGKILNAGQSCIAPDYLLIHTSIKAAFLKEAAKILKIFFPGGVLSSQDYGKIVNKKRYLYLKSLLKDGEILLGGETDDEKLKIAPTIMESLPDDSALLKEEIFGPLLPVLTWETRDELSALLDQRPDPLALYLFSRNGRLERYINTHHNFGGGCINETMLQFANPALPFGGTGASGQGNYHGEAGFRTMSHYRSMVRSPRRFSLPVKFPPYTRAAHSILRRFLR